MKNLVLFAMCILFVGCEPRVYRVYSTPSSEVIVTEGLNGETITTPVCEDYQPFPYEEAPGIEYEPVICEGACCLWQFESYYSMCEEFWCNYGNYCGWELKSEGCYPI
tara:strand:+ start:899 stop:1222 length:324 start_codon:yes stop_codon:yes gene_type:complete